VCLYMPACHLMVKVETAGFFFFKLVPIYRTICCYIMQYRIIYNRVVKILVIWLCASFCLITGYDWILLQTFLQWTVYHKP
jgi:hypothetical protein